MGQLINVKFASKYAIAEFAAVCDEREVAEVMAHVTQRGEDASQSLYVLQPCVSAGLKCTTLC